MINRKEVLSEIERLGSISTMVQAYEEIAAMRMRKIRDSVLQTRDFLTGITEVFREVQASYKKEVERLMHKKRIKDPSKMSFIQRNGKTITIFISANTGLYGDIVKKTFYMFLDEIKKEKTDIAIVGRLGKSLFDEAMPNKSVQFFESPDGFVDREAVKKVAEFLVQYEKIIVYYGQFENVVNQVPTRAVISDTELAASNTEKGEELRYLFEPSLERIMEFFESEIFASIFEQTMHESHLAKFASRMVTLDKALENIKQELKKVQFQKRVIHHRSVNKKQLDAISGMSLWS